MRAALFGAAFDDLAGMQALVRASSRITHSDPKAESGALAVAYAAQLARQHTTLSPARYVETLPRVLEGAGDELVVLLRKAASSVDAGRSTLTFAEELGLRKGVSGYVNHCVPVAIHAWLSHQTDLRAAIQAAVACGGDADSTGAIAGGIVGAGVGAEGIPQDWLQGVVDWPYSVRYLQRLSRELATALASPEKKQVPPPFSAWGLPVRNLFFLAIVLGHGGRRLLPPW
jgi:ADP-ribosylglycohydrolase